MLKFKFSSKYSNKKDEEKAKKKKNKSVKHPYSLSPIRSNFFSKNSYQKTQDQNQARNLPKIPKTTQISVESKYFDHTNASKINQKLEEEEPKTNTAVLVVIIVVVLLVGFLTLLYLCHKFDIFNERDSSK